MKRFLLIFSLLLLKVAFGCYCPKTAPSLPTGVEMRTVENFQVSDEVLDGKNYGKQLYLGDLLFLQETVSVSKGTSSLSPACPIDYGLPSLDDYKKIVDSLGEEKAYKLFTDKVNGLGMNEGQNYVTKTKSKEGLYDGTNPDSWSFKAVQAKNGKINYVDHNTYFSAPQGKCAKSKTTPPHIMIPEEELIYGKQIVISLDTKNYKKILWKNNMQYSKKDDFIKTYKEYGCQRIEVWVENLAGETVYNCQTFYIVNAFYNKKASSFDLSKLKTYEFNNITITHTGAIFFFPSTAPVAPKLEGGFYIAYQAGGNGNLHVTEFNKKRILVRDFDLGFSAKILDVTATNWGFAVLHSIGGITLRFNGYYADGSLRFSSLIYTNDNGAFKRKDQIKIWLGTGYLYGVNTMYHPYGGKVLFAKGQFVVAQYSYNSFDPETDKTSPNGHTGDVVFQFDENGENPKSAVVWATSHTCIQTMIFTGKYIAYATLGDAFPKNMKAHFWDPTSKPAGTFDQINQKYVMLSSNSNSEQLHENIPANEAGNSCGRMGGIHYNGEKYALVYTVKPCSANGQSTNLNEVGLITFDGSKGKPENIQKKLLKGLSGVNIIQIRSAKYGKNILIFYMMVPGNCGSDGKSMCGYQGIGFNYTVYFVLADFEGNIISGPFKSDKKVLNYSDDIREMKDGSLVWGYTDGSERLKFAYIPPP